MRRVAALLLAVACLAPWPWSARPRDGAAGPASVRLLGPFAGLAASVEWVRFDRAATAGRFERAYAAADRALGLDPRAPQGWIYLATHLIHERAAPEGGASPAERRRWLAAGLRRLEEGEARCADPAELAASAGLAQAWIAAIDEPTGLGWPGGARAAARQSVADLERAERLGHPTAGRVARALRAEWGFADGD